MAKTKYPKATMINLNSKAARGDASVIITFPLMKAEDHNKIKNKGKNLTIN
jgi:hypothetical protein